MRRDQFLKKWGRDEFVAPALWVIGGVVCLPLTELFPDCQETEHGCCLQGVWWGPAGKQALSDLCHLLSPKNSDAFLILMETGRHRNDLPHLLNTTNKSVFYAFCFSKSLACATISIQSICHVSGFSTGCIQILWEITIIAAKLIGPHILFGERWAQSKACRLGAPAQFVVFSSSALTSFCWPLICRLDTAGTPAPTQY